MAPAISLLQRAFAFLIISLLLQNLYKDALPGHPEKKMGVIMVNDLHQ